MSVDLVHDIQSAYRKVVDSLSRPGTVSDVSEEAAKVDFYTGCFPSTVLLALMLLDTEVTFKVFSNDEEEVTKRINQLTYAKAVEAEKADFIFVLHNAASSQVETAFRSAKTGSLMNPHESAMLIIETEKRANSVTQLVLTGPGIDTEHKTEISAADMWLDLRAERNSEYPLGVDILVSGADHTLLCLPRSTKIRKQVTC